MYPISSLMDVPLWKKLCMNIITYAATIKICLKKKDLP